VGDPVAATRTGQLVKEHEVRTQVTDTQHQLETANNSNQIAESNA
jgi:hypothetical protein